MIRVVIVEDHAIVRAGIRALLAEEPDLSILAEFPDGSSALQQLPSLSPDLLLVDLTLPSMDGVEVLRRVRSVSPRTRSIVLSMHASPEFVRPALQAGASGYVVKGAGLDALVDALRTVAAGGTFLDESLEPSALDLRSSTDDLERLTPREREILRLVAQGNTNRQIGELLGLSPKTVDAHRTNLMRKLDLHDAQALTRFAVRRGLA
ncbi:MAG: response regulator transcription factor [Myxococcales bacterium]|nr:response regulator transcription factor [Polyangiaceae bacterium]MDW8249155.1 response regulator transcription factor [Myxococcales bacterium]